LGVTLGIRIVLATLSVRLLASQRDAVHAAVMLNNDVKRIATYDTGFDEIPGIRRWKMPEHDPPS
jgi:predicted nucleic acid-binding protein